MLASALGRRIQRWKSQWMGQHWHVSLRCRMRPVREVRQKEEERRQAERLRRQHGPSLPSAERARHPEFSCGATLRW